MKKTFLLFILLAFGLTAAAHAGETQINGRLTADGVVPVAKGKHYEKYTIHRLNGTATSKELSFSCTMGDKPFKFKGVRVAD